jgi:hypothetical protein
MDNHARDKDNHLSWFDRGAADRLGPRARPSATFGAQHTAEYIAKPKVFWCLTKPLVMFVWMSLANFISQLLALVHSNRGQASRVGLQLILAVNY